MLDSSPIGAAAAAAIEAAEARAWADLYAAAPPAWAESVGLGTRTYGGTVALRWAATGRRYFSRAIGLGVVEPATRALVEEIVAGYERAGITMFLLQSLPHCAPRDYERWLGELGLEPFDVQDRVVRDGRPSAPADAHGRDLRVERVTSDTVAEWVEFMERVYRLESGPWLPELVGRPGWHQYVAREEGEIVGARGMHIGRDGTAWLGMDGPVPGLTTDDYEPDEALCTFVVADGLAHGARAFIADIEVPSAEQATPAYEYFARLGFTRPYARTHWARL